MQIAIVYPDAIDAMARDLFYASYMSLLHIVERNASCRECNTVINSALAPVRARKEMLSHKYEFVWQIRVRRVRRRAKELGGKFSHRMDVNNSLR